MIEDADSDKPLSERDEPLEEDLADGEESEMVRCPHCGKYVYEETVKCPHCNDWILDEPGDESGHSSWFWPIVIAIGIVMILVTLVYRLVR